MSQKMVEHVSPGTSLLVEIEYTAQQVTHQIGADWRLGPPGVIKGTREENFLMFLATRID